jgi:uncharacterized protein YutE (UPF0331/DUF86 family)
VHGYLRIDADRVAEFLAKAPAAFTDFAHAIRRWLAAVSAPPSA